mmetsp:Transcript_57803/g.181500  ORF Transcript_57803/g.181500 Transcript_57803/m.181500 type:complete len:208 (-) Transcript_57803:319-942(-)
MLPMEWLAHARTKAPRGGRRTAAETAAAGTGCAEPSSSSRIRRPVCGSVCAERCHQSQPPEESEAAVPNRENASNVATDTSKLTWAATPQCRTASSTARNSAWASSSGNRSADPSSQRGEAYTKRIRRGALQQSTPESARVAPPCAASSFSAALPLRPGQCATRRWRDGTRTSAAAVTAAVVAARRQPPPWLRGWKKKPCHRYSFSL